MTTPEVPDWINKPLFQGLVKQHYQNFKGIETFTTKAAVGKAENYQSIVFRIQIEMQMKDGTKEDVNYVLKIPLKNDCGTDHGYHDTFVNELDMYDRVVPELEKIYAKNTSLLVKFKPLHYKFTDKELLPKCDYLLMEDLHAKGFRNINRILGLDLCQMEAVLKKMAQWHAASVARVSQIGDYEKDYIKKYYTDSVRKHCEYADKLYNGPFLECMEKSYNLDQRDKNLITKYVSQLTDIYMDLGRINASEFKVLNHGDFWCNNCMFKVKEESNEILDVCFVDLQQSSYGTPAEDLFSLLMSSPQLGIKISKFDYFVEFYHRELSKHLALLDSNRNVPTLEQFQQILFQNSYYAFVSAQRYLPVVLYIDHPAYESDDDSFGFSRPACVEQMNMILPWLIAKNYIR